MRIQQGGSRRSLFFPRKRTLSYMFLGTAAMLLTGLWLALSSQSALPPTPTKVVVGGDQSPVGGVFASAGTPALGLGGASGLGAMTFFAMVREGSTPLGIFLSSGNSITKVAAVGDPTPLGGTFAFLSLPVQNHLGQIAFGATLKAGSTPEGIFLVSGGQTTKVVAVGEGTPVGVISSVLAFALNNYGEVAFGAKIAGGSARQGIFLASGGSLSKVIAEGDMTPVGGSFSFFGGYLALALNDAGAMAFRALLTGGIPLANGSVPQGIFVASRGGTVSKVAAVGDPTPVGGTFASFTPPALNNAGEVTFGATLADGAVLQGVFLVSQGQIIPVVAEGDLTPAGGRFALAVGVSPPPGLNDRGEIAFSAKVIGLSPRPASGLFLSSRGLITKLVLDSDPTPLGGTYLGDKLFRLSNTGELLFMSSVDVNGDGNPDNQGIFSVRASLF